MRRCHRKVAASTRSRNSCRSIPRTYFSCVVALSPGSRRSSRRVVGRARSASVPRSMRPRTVNRARFFALEPEDLLKYGLIPEFVGRLPVVATLEDLDEAALKLI